MKITPITVGQVLPLLAAKAIKGDTDFAGKTAAPPPPPAPAAGQGMANPLGNVSMLVALASVAKARIPLDRKETHARLGKGVDLLERLHRHYLDGQNPIDTLTALEEWLEEECDPDPFMEEFSDEIALRVQVELAKLDRKL